MSDAPRRRLVGVRLVIRGGDGHAARRVEYRLAVSGRAVAVAGGDMPIAEEVMHGIVLSGPYLTAAKQIGPMYGIRLGEGRIHPSDGAAYLVAVMAWYWFRGGIDVFSLEDKAGWRGTEAYG